jgi:hypothetical protein
MAHRPAIRAIDLAPGSTYEVVTRQAVDDLRAQVDRIEARLNAVLFGVAASLAIELWRAFLR